MVEPVIIGRATLYLGDARDIVPTLAADVLISDPPYGNSTVLGMGGGDRGDGGMWADVGIPCDDTLTVRDEVLRVAALPFAVLASVRSPAPPGTKTTLIWEKGEHVGAGDLSMPWKPNVEVIHIGGDGWSGPRRQTSVLRFNAIAGCVGRRNDGFRWHPFEKPVELMEHLIERAPPGVVLDPFMGGATTALACAKLGRDFIGIEMVPEFYQLALQRLREANGDDAGPLFGEAA
jgi:hypothetical protein